MTSFRDRFRTVDVLLIDDIQFIAQKERTQEEFFHTFNALHESMKQIVIASRPAAQGAGGDRGPAALALRVGPDRRHPAARPGDQGRHPAEEGGERAGATLPTDVALFVASNVRTNVRELEGALTRLIAWCQLNHMEITLAADAAVPQAVHRHAGAQGHHRGHSARRRRAVRHERRPT